MSHKCKDDINKTVTLQEYIKAYEKSFEDTVDMSPYSIERTTEKRMLKELKELILRNQKHKAWEE